LIPAPTAHSMEWREISRETHRCPCGKGYATAIRERDVDRRVRTRFLLDCDCVHPGYEPYPYEFQKDGLWYTAIRWVREKTLGEVARLRAEADALLREADALAETRYLEKWLGHFSSASKRIVWRRLRAAEPDHIWFPALPTFYRQTRKTGMAEYLIRHFRVNPRRALDILGIEDLDIVRLRRAAVARMNQADRMIFRD
jgi:hypothetical protein